MVLGVVEVTSAELVDRETVIDVTFEGQDGRPRVVGREGRLPILVSLEVQLCKRVADAHERPDLRWGLGCEDFHEFGSAFREERLCVLPGQEWRLVVERLGG